MQTMTERGINNPRRGLVRNVVTGEALRDNQADGRFKATAHHGCQTALKSSP
jgi:hypothetical protein